MSAIKVVRTARVKPNHSHYLYWDWISINIPDTLCSEIALCKWAFKAI